MVRVLTNYLDRFLTTALCRGGNLLLGKRRQNVRAYPMQLHPQGKSQNTATTGFVPIEKSGRIKLRPLAAHRPSVAVFYSVAGNSPFRTIKGSSWVSRCKTILGKCF